MNLRQRMSGMKEYYHQCLRDPAVNDDHLAMAWAMANAYVDRWGDPLEQFEVIAVEEEFVLPILHPETGEETQYKYTGFRDKRVFDKQSEEFFVMDHKTSSYNLDDFGNDFWQRWTIDPQATIYALAAMQQEHEFDGFLVDAVKKPRIKHKAKQTHEEYFEELHERIMKEPEKHIARVPWTRTDEQIMLQNEELFRVARLMKWSHKRGEDAYYHNYQHCFSFGRSCEFLPICSGQAAPDGTEYRLKVLEDGDDRPADRREEDIIVSHSRAKKYVGCPTQYYYHYIYGGRGIEPAQAQDKTALHIGSLFHTFIDILFGELNELEGSDSA